MPPQIPTLGRSVHYTLTEQDVSAIVAARSIRAGTPGNSVKAGDIYPATIVRVWNIEGSPPSCNLQVHLDGPDIFWATSRYQAGTAPSGFNSGTWQWPTRP